MEVRTCKECKKMFNYLAGPPICPNCRDRLEEKFQEVKEYIRENPHDGITDVAKETGVSANQIRRWVREERLSFSDESGIGIDCESCGKMIKSGRLCQSCKDKLMGNVDNMLRGQESIVERKHREAARMRFLDK